MALSMSIFKLTKLNDTAENNSYSTKEYKLIKFNSTIESSSYNVE